MAEPALDKKILSAVSNRTFKKHNRKVRKTAKTEIFPAGYVLFVQGIISICYIVPAVIYGIIEGIKQGFRIGLETTLKAYRDQLKENYFKWEEKNGRLNTPSGGNGGRAKRS